MSKDKEEPQRLRTNKQLQDARGKDSLDITNFVTLEEYRQLRPQSAVDIDD